MTVRSAVFDLLPEPVKRRHLVNYELKTGEPELRLVRRLLGSSGVLVDVGANKGIYSALAIRYRRRVIAFEPVPEEAMFLRQWIGSRGVVHQVALSDRAGKMVLHIPTLGGKDVTARSTLEESVDPDMAHRSIEVETTTLDSFSLDGIAFVKIDVEGHESAVLRGAAETLARSRPNVMVEVEEPRTPGAVATVTAMMKLYGYDGFWLDKGELRSIDVFDPAVHQAHPPKHGQSLGSYVNNLLWTPVERPFELDLAGTGR